MTALLAGAVLGRISWANAAGGKSFEVTHSDAEWRKLLRDDVYEVLRRSGTERPFTSALLHEARNGTFTCAGCERDLFASNTKFESGTGWPSFWQPLPGGVLTERDTSLGMVRDAVECSRCGGHLGHVFDDGPKPTGLRYCMNGIAMHFRPAAA
jgi:peptide-methionine (R)-S-oxide reductase